ncbi:MAG TPA: quinoprotein dehydrogenase-associated SoxYZ-like carrier [Rhodocyclaceae bacterium]|jgi:sulfur-oxidizing protein SoxY|nr:quinoprotein dehydrogenase-associated SoxYZ-like carrier [Rhodocyclaceae bacterium]
MSVRRSLGAAAILAMVALHVPAAGAAEAEPAADIWHMVRTSLFGNRPISEQSEGVVELDAPARAEDAATVPIAIRTKLPQNPERYVRRIYLVIDRNPSPVGATFTFTPESGRADLETRVRIEEYTNVRAIAEVSDGSLYMATRYVKASGGCSAPAGKDQAAAAARLGKMKLKLDEAAVPGKPVQAQLMISHPNNSGMAMDQLTRLYTPPHFVRRIEVTYAGRPVLTAEVDFTISENPNFRFYFVPRGEGELKAEVVDTDDLKFESSIAVRREGAGS